MWVEEWVTIRNKRTFVQYSSSNTKLTKGSIIHSHGMFISTQVEDQSEGVISSLEYCVLHGWKVVRYDERGQGKSEPSDTVKEQTWEGLTRDIDFIIEKFANPNQPIILSGLSMGTGASIHYFLKNPTKIHGLLLMLPPTAWETRVNKVRIE